MQLLQKLNIFSRSSDNAKFNTAKMFFGTAIFLLFVYFLYHLITGERGLVAYSQTKQDLARTKAELDSTIAEKERLQNKVKLMSNESLDLDMLEEVAKSELGYTNKDEIIYFPR